MAALIEGAHYEPELEDFDKIVRAINMMSNVMEDALSQPFLAGVEQGLAGVAAQIARVADALEVLAGKRNDNGN